MLKSVLSKFLTYGLGNILQSALRILLLPLYMRFFAPDEYGVISSLTVTYTLLGLLANAGIMNGLFRLYYEREGAARRELVGTTWLWYAAVACASGLVLFTQAPLFSQWLFQRSGVEAPIRLLGIMFVFTQLQQVPFSLLRLEKKAGLYVIFSLSLFLFDFVAKLISIVLLQRGVVGFFESSAVASALTAGLMLPFALKYAALRFDLSVFKQLLRLGLPYIFSGVAMWALEVSDRLLLLRFAGEAAVGIYSLAYSFAQIFKIVLATPASLLIDPFFFGYAAKNPAIEVKALLRRLVVYYCLAGSVAYLIIALGSGELVRTAIASLGAHERYLEAVQLVPIITLSYLLYFATISGSLAGLLIKRPEVTSIVFIVAALSNVGLNLVFMPRWGTWAAAIDTVAAYLLMDILLYAVMEKIFPVGHQWKALFMLSGCLALAFAIGWCIKFDPPLVSLFVKVPVGVLTFTLLVFLSGNILTPPEKDWLRACWRRGCDKLALLRLTCIT